MSCSKQTDHDRRVSDLLRSNNELLERARTAERKCEESAIINKALTAMCEKVAMALMGEIEASTLRTMLQCEEGAHEVTKTALKSAQLENEDLTAERVAAVARARREGMEEAAEACENHTWARNIDWWMNTTKKEAGAEGARECAAAIRRMAEEA